MWPTSSFSAPASAACQWRMKCASSRVRKTAVGATAPTSLIASGAGLAEYGVRNGWRLSAAICMMKIAVQPLVVWGLARAIGLPHLETQVVVLLAWG